MFSIDSISVRRKLLIILTVALLIRLVFIAVLPPNGYIFSDAQHYDKAAVSLLAGDGWGENYNRSPLYPVLMAGVYGLFGHSFVAMRVFEAALGVLLCWLIFLIALRLFNPSVALLAAGLAALHPHFLIIAGILYPTQLYTVLMALTIYLLLRFDEQHQYGCLLLAAVIAGLAALTIPALLFTLPFILLWLMATKVKWLHRLAAVLLFIVAFVAVLTPWTLHNYQQYGRLTLVRPVPHTVFPNLEDSKAQKQRIESGFRDTTDYLKANPRGTEKDRLSVIIGNYIKHPMASLRYLAGELTHFWALYPDRLDTSTADYQQQIKRKDARIVSVDSSLWRLANVTSIFYMTPIFLMALIGSAAAFPWKRALYLPLGAVVGQSLGYSLIYAEVRYRIPIETYVLMLTAFGLYRVIMAAGRHKIIGARR